MPHLFRSLAIASVSALLLLPAVGQVPPGALPPGAKKIPGEKWRQKMTMRMEGMSLPGRTEEVCTPVDKPEQGVAQPPDKDCRIYDVVLGPNKYSSKFSCTGKNASEGTIATSRQGNTMISDIVVRSKDGEMTMHSESTRLGTACEFVDYSGVKYEAPVIPDACIELGKKMKQEPARLHQYTGAFFSKVSATCRGKPQVKDYCELAQSHAGYLALRRQEFQYDQQSKAVGNNDMFKSDPGMRTPLLTSVQGCNLGKGAAGVAALRAKLLASAEEKSEWHFMVAEGDDALLTKLQGIAKENCAGRGFTEAKAKKFLGLCLLYGPDLIAGRFANARNTALGGQNDEVMASGEPGAGGSGQNGAGGQGASGSEAAPAEGEKPNKAKDALDKGKKVLRGILGR